MEEIREGLRGLLERAGWEPGRGMDVGDLVSSLRSVGFDVSPAATDFLAHFTPLMIEHEPSVEIGPERSFCWTRFDPRAVATARDARIADRCSAIVGKSLCPVGTDGFHFTLYIAEDYTFFAGRDASVYRYADSVNGLLTAMRDGSRPALVGEWAVE